MSTYFTADLHLGHERVAKLRGFDTVQAHDAAVIAGLETVMRSEDDVLWVLGDLALGKWREALEAIAVLRGTKHLVIGNHDKVFPAHRDNKGERARRFYNAYAGVFASVRLAHTMMIAGQTVTLSHFPFTADHTDPPRHMEYRQPDVGQWLVHGHTHAGEAFDGKQIHVGLDAWGLIPVLLDVLVDHILESPDGVAEPW